MGDALSVLGPVDASAALERLWEQVAHASPSGLNDCLVAATPRSAKITLEPVVSISEVLTILVLISAVHSVLRAVLSVLGPVLSVWDRTSSICESLCVPVLITSRKYRCVAALADLRRGILVSIRPAPKARDDAGDNLAQRWVIAASNVDGLRIRNSGSDECEEGEDGERAFHVKPPILS